MSWVVGIVIVGDVSRATEFEIAGMPFEVAMHTHKCSLIFARGAVHILHNTNLRTVPPTPTPG